MKSEYCVDEVKYSGNSCLSDEKNNNDSTPSTWPDESMAYKSFVYWTIACMMLKIIIDLNGEHAEEECAYGVTNYESTNGIALGDSSWKPE
jgi:hypothetical protein